MSHVHEIVTIRVDLAAGVSGEAADYARAKVATVAKYSPADISYAKVRLSTDGPRLLAAHASLDVNGTPVNANASAETYQEAVDLLHDKLQHQLADMGR
ncbi:ribosome-associated translation inhibitor RaiA [Saccharothrix ecbatanensis]|uniref:Ribosome-associated translation inhibitor RaiA n=1 Tax=Saccharothrix ecbatanensis TaxID=1105145 RepID=A0A7W9HF69_9PSEU|nr:HPF/RaiA family ribosome-associated protein [Saccharothrix ecbatanensis]MBB5801167.1 ribosome-associated translation inhibitor RaiA [Saccharothrix ecbatanensis]